ncbi:MAG: hypothetical protein ACRDTZ_10945 [Pseudonocardiaceae bacterium]
MVNSDRNWYEVYLLVLAVMWVATAWLTGSADQTIVRTFPSWSQHLWYGGLLVGVMVALLGITLASVAGLLVERAALFWLAGLCMAYGLAFWAAADRSDPYHAAYVVVFVLGFAAVNLARATQIRSAVDAKRAALRKMAQS